MFRCFDFRTSIDLYSEVVPMKSNEASGFSTSSKLKTIVYRSPKMDIIALQWKSGQEVSLYRLNWQRVSSFESLSKALTVRNLIIDTHSVNLKEPFIVWSCALKFFCMGLIFNVEILQSKFMHRKQFLDHFFLCLSKENVYSFWSVH